MSLAGFAIKELTDRPTHLIFVRAALGIEYSSAAWVYEERRKSMPRWYKVIGFSEQGHWIMLQCHLVEKDDSVKPEQSDLAPRPQDVEL